MKVARRWLALGFWGLSSVVLFLGVATLRAVHDGERELAASDAAFDANELHAAIAHARRAASAYAPGARHVEQAYDRLSAIARGAEAAGMPGLPALAWQAQRAAALESVSLSQPFPERLEEANRNLARLATGAGAGVADSGKSARRLLERGRTRPSQARPWGGLLALGLLTAGFGLAFVAGRAVLPDGRLSWARGRFGLVLLALGAACWAFAAFRA